MQKPKTKIFGLFLVFAVILLAVAQFSHSVSGAVDQDAKKDEALFPRFASLRFNEVNLRAGPGRDHRIQLTYKHRGLPIEILAKSGNWFKVRDHKGNIGWVGEGQTNHSRHAILRPWEPGVQLKIRKAATPEATAAVIGHAPSLVLVKQCNGFWCQVDLDGYSGWLEQIHLWGVYPDEKFMP